MTQLNVSWNKWELARGCRNGPCFLANLEPRLKRYAYPLSAYCLLIACSGVLVTIFILNEMRLDYSPLHRGFAYKTTEQLWHSRALLRCIVCSHHDEVLVAVVCSFRIGVPAIARNCVRASCTRWCGGKLALCPQQWFGWPMNVRGYRLSRAVLCTDAQASACTSVANCCYVSAGRRRAVRTERRRPTDKASLV